MRCCARRRSRWKAGADGVQLLRNAGVGDDQHPHAVRKDRLSCQGLPQVMQARLHVVNEMQV